MKHDIDNPRQGRWKVQHCLKI